MIKRRQWLSGMPALLWPWHLRAQAPKGAPSNVPDTPPVISVDQVLQFPRDFGAHPPYRTEWWYFTGQLQSGQGSDKRPWGFQITFFRSRVDVAKGNTSRQAEA